MFREVLCLAGTRSSEIDWKTSATDHGLGDLGEANKTSRGFAMPLVKTGEDRYGRSVI